MSTKFFPARRGFTLTELLIAIAIIAILAAVILPILQTTGHTAGRRRVCLNNVRQLALACATYESANSTYPPVIGSNGESLLVRILPMIEQKNLYDQFRAGNRTAHAIDELAIAELSHLRCPSAATADFNADVSGSFTSHYTGCAGCTAPISMNHQVPLAYELGPGDLGLNGLFSPKLNDDGTLNIGSKNGVNTDDVVDGMSNTLAILETSRGDFKSKTLTFTNVRARWSWGLEPSTQVRVNWGRSVDRLVNSYDDTKGVANPYHGICISSEHAGGANVANGDVQFALSAKT